MRREDITDFYVLIRLWATSEDVDDNSRPFYPCHADGDGPITWALTQNFKEARLFKSADIAKRIVRNVGEFKKRLQRGWGFEVVKVWEELLDTNIDFGYEENAA